MASFGEAYGFTPEQFFCLTLPQLAEYGEYAKRSNERLKESSSKSSGKSGSSQSISSLDELVARYGEKSPAKSKAAAPEGNA
jgi:hypothetical protein